MARYKNPHAVALARRSTIGRTAEKSQRMKQQWDAWRKNGGRPRQVALAVPEAHREWLGQFTREDLAELTWVLADALYDRELEVGTLPVGDAWHAHVARVVRWWGQQKLTRAKARAYCQE